MPKGYVIARAVVTNATQWSVYAAAAGEAMKKYGGTPIARGGAWKSPKGKAAPAT